MKVFGPKQTDWMTKKNRNHSSRIHICEIKVELILLTFSFGGLIYTPILVFLFIDIITASRQRESLFEVV